MYNNLKTFFIYTLGCKVNQYESQWMRQSLEKAGLRPAADDEIADIYIINSCTVTATADKKSMQAVRRFKQINPEGIVVLTGCMPQAAPDKKDFSPADIIMGNKTNIDIVKNISSFTGTKLMDISPHKMGDEYIRQSVSSFGEKTRAEIKIEDGCNRFCTYCLIPYARGRVRSRPVDDIVKEAYCLAKNGYKEIVLVGINLSAYCYEEKGLADVVEEIGKVEGIERIRLGSLEPDHLTREVIHKLSLQRKLCPQFHISLQSGCDATLKRMNRHYTASEYFALCQALREKFTDCTLTTDVMVGFPGETQEDFNESLEFIKLCKFEKVHIFPYSRRKGTPADKYENQVSQSEKARRAKIMAEVAGRIREECLKSMLGSRVSVLTQEYNDGFTFGYTPNYTPVYIKGKIETGIIVNIQINEFFGDMEALSGTVLSFCDCQAEEK